MQWAIKLNSALATAVTRDFNGHKVNIYVSQSPSGRTKIEKKWQSIVNGNVM